MAVGPPTNLGAMEDQADNEAPSSEAPAAPSSGEAPTAPTAPTTATAPPPAAPTAPAPAAPARAANGPATTPGPGTSAISEAEWPAKVADTIEEVVGAVHDRVVRPLTLVARGLVFGIIISVMALMLCILAVIAVIRLLDVYAFGGRVWASDALLGALLVAAGVFAWTKRGTRGAEEP